MLISALAVGHGGHQLEDQLQHGTYCTGPMAVPQRRLIIGPATIGRGSHVVKLGVPASFAGLDPHTPFQQHALAACRAALVEAAGDHATSADTTPRRPGSGACLATYLISPTRSSARDAAYSPSARRRADGPLSEARELFAAMGYAPASTRQTHRCRGDGANLIATADRWQYRTQDLDPRRWLQGTIWHAGVRE